MFRKVYQDVKADPQKHISNRSSCYHPSPLHKSIREDDIDTFQSLLYKSNYSVNYIIEFSKYERAQTIDSNISLIQIAATYGSIKIFKFLWMQTDIELPKNLLLYAFFGCNNEIIHLCEEKLPDKKAVLQTIYLNRLDFLDYYIENFSDQFEEQEEEIKKILSQYRSNDDKEDFYDELNSEQLYAAIDFYNVPVIKSALCKICFIIKNIELNNELHKLLNHSLLVASLPHFELFKFLYMQRDPNEEPDDCESYFSCIEKSIIFLTFDSFLFLLDKLKNHISFYSIFSKSIYYSRYSITNYLLDLSIEEIESDPKNAPIYSEIFKSITINDLIIQIQNYNEEIIVKMIRLFSFFINDDYSLSIAKYLKEFATSKMIIDLLKKIMQYLDHNAVIQLILAFEKYDKAVADFIKKT